MQRPRSCVKCNIFRESYIVCVVRAERVRRVLEIKLKWQCFVGLNIWKILINQTKKYRLITADGEY